MTRHPLTVATMLVLIVVGGCNDSTTEPPEPPSGSPGSLFYEPPGFCLLGNSGSRTLTLYNLSDSVLVWEPLSVPAGSSGLAGTITLAPRSFQDLVWTWTPTAAYPVEDSLVAGTSDPLARRVVVPVVARDPEGFVDVTPPGRPRAGVPADGAVFVLERAGTTAEARIPVAWSRLEDCSGIARYILEIALDPGFSQVVFRADTLTTAGTEVIAEDGDQGTAYWRVSAVDSAGLTGLPSIPRSWVVRDP